MDSKLSVQHHNGVSKPPVHHHGGGNRKGGSSRQSSSGRNKGIKVVYISSPMMLTASAEEFRAVVQEFTGRDSNVADHDLAAASYAGGAPTSSSNNSWSSSSSSSYSSFGHASPTTTTTGAARALPQTMATATAGPGRLAEYAASGGGLATPPSFQGMYDQTGSLLYGQDCYW
ncbi:hypothetical protein QOZ80_3BG0281940 [Eleusine coracana subsp. coracana]|nr:hypothetical protein QOZ80_3BG0281940 [Eleusine coracana subsp. coracana]